MSNLNIIKIDKIYTIDEVLNFYTPLKERKDYDGFLVKMNSQRYQLFKYKGCTCVKCGRVGTHFRLQRHFENKVYHFGLYSDDEIEMTKDHCIPRKHGGSDTIDNYQVMCSECNFEKDHLLTYDDLMRGSFKSSEYNLD